MLAVYWNSGLSPPAASCSIRTACPMTSQMPDLVNVPCASQHIQRRSGDLSGLHDGSNLCNAGGAKDIALHAERDCVLPALPLRAVGAPLRALLRQPKNVARDAALEGEVPSLAWRICTTHVNILDFLSLTTIPWKVGSAQSPSHALCLQHEQKSRRVLTSARLHR